MNMRIRCIPVFILLLCALQAAASPYYFKSMDAREGLSQNTVNAIVEDGGGFMWFGTKDGLNRYDGSGFRIFRHDPSDESGLCNNFIRALVEDANGDLWIGTDNGLDVYVQEQDAFRHVLFPEGDASKASVSALARDSEGNVWAAVEQLGLARFDMDGGGRSFFSCAEHPYLSNVTSIFFDAAGNIWIGSYGRGLYVSRDGMKTVLPYADPDSGVEIFRDRLITSIVRAPFNNIYVGSLDGGVRSVNLVTGKSAGVLLHDGDGGLVRCRSILSLSPEELLVGSESGLFVVDPAAGRSEQMRSSYCDRYSLSANSIYSICRDSRGGLWIGTYFGGVNYWSPQYSAFHKYYPRNEPDGLMGKRVREIREARDGTLWVGTEDGGLYRFDPETGRFSFCEASAEFNNIHGLCVNGDELWVGTISKGLKVIDAATGELLRSYENTAERKELNGNDIYSICRTGLGDILIGTQFGMMRWRSESGTFEEVEAMAGRHVYDMLEDMQGNLWVATYSDGVFRLGAADDGWVQYRHDPDDAGSLPYDMVLSIFEDSRQRIWLTTQGGGLCMYSEADDSFVTMSTADGLPDNVVYRIVEDGKGMFWVGTNDGLACFNPDNPQDIRIYTEDNGLLCDQFNYKSGCLASDGKIYMGCLEGLLAFDPGNLRVPAKIPEPVISSFSLFGREQRPGGPGSPLGKIIRFTDRMVLRHDQNSFSFRIVAPNYVASGGNCLEYMLDGYDDGWKTASLNSDISYSNLKFGRYVFRARSAGAQASDVSGLQLEIVIRPPLWLSRAAVVLYVVIVMGLSAVGVWRLRKRNQTRYKLYAAQMEREKEKAVYDSKIEFFTNIAHEIKTPLTLIYGPLENLLDNRRIDGEIREDLQIMRQNTERLIDLTRQLLDFRRIEDKSYSLDFENCDITATVEKVFKSFTVSARQEHVEFLLDTPEEPIRADVNREAFTKMINNLFSNGLKYAGTFFSVTLSLSEDGAFFLVRTENDGNLVPDSMKEEVFKPFVRLSGGNREKLSVGTGIGLGLSRSLAELHHGSLAMEPGGGGGTNVFLLRLPVRQEKAVPPAAAASAETGGAYATQSPSRDSRRPSVLVVEDDAEMRAFIIRQLKDSYNLFSASNGREALEVLDESPVKLVISDVMMPVMDGMELCRIIKSNVKYSHIPVILLTAKTNIQSKIEGVETGADIYMEKPFSAKYLAACVNNLVSSREKLRRTFAASPFVDANSVALSSADEEFIGRLNGIMEARWSDSEFSMDELASELNMSRSNFYRKISGVLDMTPNEYLRLVRLKKAAQLLQSGSCRVNEVCYITGFSSPSYFAKCFSRQFGITPKEFMEKSRSERSGQ